MHRYASSAVLSGRSRFTGPWPASCPGQPDIEIGMTNVADSTWLIDTVSMKLKVAKLSVCVQVNGRDALHLYRLLPECFGP